MNNNFLVDKFKKILDRSRPQAGTQQIVIRSGGDLTRGNSGHVADWVYSFDNRITCSDGSSLPIEAGNSVVTGVSEHKNEVLIRQIVAAVIRGYTPFVISTRGKEGLLYRVLRTVYEESAIDFVNEEYASGSYAPFQGLSADDIADFFCSLVADFQSERTNGMLIRNYVNVCVRVFFADGRAVSNLAAGQLDHMRLLQEIDSLSRAGRISENVRQDLLQTANSAQSVSVTVLSIIQDYMYKLRRVCASKPTITIRNANAPQIQILGVNGCARMNLGQGGAGASGGGINLRQGGAGASGGGMNLGQGGAGASGGGMNLGQNGANAPGSGMNLEDAAKGRCFYLELRNEVPGTSSNEQCFQWYMARSLRLEMERKSSMRNRPLLVIIDDLSDTLLKWFWWAVELPNSIKLIHYDDLYSKLSSAQNYRQQFVGMAEMIYFFSVLNEESAEWASRTFGTHVVPKVVVTDQPYRTFTDVIFHPKSYAHDEVEKPWFSSHEIQHLGDMGIVYSRRYKIFKPCYRENGRTYIDRRYKRQRVNFCTFEFR